jgi:hypothetical protein
MYRPSLASTLGIGMAALVAIKPAAGGATSALPAVQAAELQSQVDQVLRHSAPGGRPISPTQVEWARDGVTLTLAAPGSARAANYANCPRRYACLWQDFDGVGRRVQFSHYRTYQLRAYGMPPFTDRGASSYQNHHTGGAEAILHADFDFTLRGHGNLYGSLNDRGTSITLRP